MGWPQITLIVLSCLSAGIVLSKHGQPRDDNYNFGITLLANVITYALLWAGGFFS